MYYKEQKMTGGSSIKDQLGKKLVDTAVKKLDNWIFKELEKLRYGNFPVCLDFDDKTLYIGGLFVKTINKNMYQVYDSEKTIHIFYSKYAATLYSLLIYAKHIKIADSILKHDISVAKNYDDINFYKKLLTKIVKKANSEDIDVIAAKLHEAKCRFQHNIEELEKTIINAKYMKVWEKLK